MSAPIPFSEALRLDAELVRLTRGASSVRLALGDALHALWASGGHYELGFSSFDAYARERCQRTGRWAADTRTLAHRLERLPKTRATLKAGAIGWSTAELLARHVTADTELAWLEKARDVTVRELRTLLAPGNESSAEVESESEPIHHLTVSATREDGWLFEGARELVRAVAGSVSPDRVLQTLLAEGYSTLLELVPDHAALLELGDLESQLAAESQAHAARCAQRKRWREEAEEHCETRGPAANFDTHDAETLSSSDTASPGETSRSRIPRAPEALDRAIRRLCGELLERDFALGVVAENARKADVWRRLGFATEAQYARERLGVSVSSLKAKRALAARAAHVPELAAALAGGRIGYEAAYLLSRVVTPSTAREWLERARHRTIKHLPEEVDAAELLVRMGEPRDQRPLDDASLDALFELERSIVSGDWVGQGRDSWAGAAARRDPPGDGSQRTANSQMSGVVSQSNGADRERPAMSRPSQERAGSRLARRFGRVTLRFRVTETTYRFWRALERAFLRVSARVCRGRVSFLRFLCENFRRIWAPALRHARLTESGALPEYFAVYRRDAFRCTSPVCTRRDVTPHHLVFRSHGGGDEAENVVSLCVWCHLSGVHEGRIAAEPPASKIRWRIGRSGTVRIDGRTLVTETPR